jgi:hypothetical protein
VLVRGLHIEGTIDKIEDLLRGGPGKAGWASFSDLRDASLKGRHEREVTPSHEAFYDIIDLTETH